MTRLPLCNSAKDSICARHWTDAPEVGPPAAPEVAPDVTPVDEPAGSATSRAGTGTVGTAAACAVDADAVVDGGAASGRGFDAGGVGAKNEHPESAAKAASAASAIDWVDFMAANTCCCATLGAPPWRERRERRDRVRLPEQCP